MGRTFAPPGEYDESICAVAAMRVVAAITAAAWSAVQVQHEPSLASTAACMQLASTRQHRITTIFATQSQSAEN